jgi:hypothetical protein
LLVTEGAYVPKVWAASRASQIEGELRISLSSVDDQTVERRINCSSVCPSPVASQIEGEPDFRRVTVELTFWKWRFDTRSTSEVGLGAKIAGAEIAGFSTVLTVGISPLVEIVGRWVSALVGAVGAVAMIGKGLAVSEGTPVSKA